MTNLYYFSFCIQYFVPFYVNYCLAVAEPLVGENVVEANDGEFPSVVSLGAAPGNHVLNHFCTGTLISKKHVLTAAHCLEVNNETESYMKPGGFVVTVGSIDRTQGTKYNVEEWKNFEEWVAEKRITIDYDEDDEELIHDIAVVTLTEDVVENIKPARLSNLNYEGVPNKTVVIAGWGETNSNERPIKLQRADLQVINRETCLYNIDVGNFPLEMIVNHFCTVAQPTVALGCGDSGGPVFVNGDEIIGVNIANCEIPNPQNMHAAVKFYLQFIRSILNPKPHCEKTAKIEYMINEFYDEE